MTVRDRDRIESGWQRTTVSLAIVTGVALVVGGCSPTDERSAMPELSLTEAKTETQELEMRIVDAFPKGVVASADQRQEGVLLACGDDQYQWTGGIDLTLTAALTNEDVASTVVSAFEGIEGFSSMVEDLQSGGATAVVSGREGLSFVGGVDPDSLVSIVSASRCFPLSGDESPFGRY